MSTPGCAGGPAAHRSRHGPPAASASARTALRPIGLQLLDRPAATPGTDVFHLALPPPHSAGRWQIPRGRYFFTNGSNGPVSPFSTAAISSPSVRSMAGNHALPAPEEKTKPRLSGCGFLWHGPVSIRREPLFYLPVCAPARRPWASRLQAHRGLLLLFLFLDRFLRRFVLGLGLLVLQHALVPHLQALLQVLKPVGFVFAQGPSVFFLLSSSIRFSQPLSPHLALRFPLLGCHFLQLLSQLLRPGLAFFRVIFFTSSRTGFSFRLRRRLCARAVWIAPRQSAPRMHFNNKVVFICVFL